MMRKNFFLLSFLFSLVITSHATNISFDGLNFKIDDENSSHVTLNNTWRFSIGDSHDWSATTFDDRKWDTVYFPFTIESLIPFHYKGSVWFRSTFTVDKKDASTPLSFIIEQYGASEIYIDGKLIQKFGVIGNSVSTEESFNPQGMPVSFTVDSSGLHHIAIRYSNHSILSDNSSEAELEVFDIDISTAQDAIGFHKLRNFKENTLTAIGIGIFLTLSIINFILFLFYKHDKANLFYSIFSAAVTVTFIVSSIQYSSSSASISVLMDKLNTAFLLVSNFFLVALVYSFIYDKTPKRLWIILAITVLALCFILIDCDIADMIKNTLNLYCVIEIVIIVTITYLKKIDPSKKIRKRLKIVLFSLIALAIIGLFINKIISIVIFCLLVLICVVPIAGIIFIVPIYMTIRHAKSFAVTNKNLEEQLIQVKELSAKTIEQEKEKKKILENQNERLEHLVTERTAELAQKNLEIKDSINYAHRIQKAILTKTEEINETLKDCFILFKPKDIVSGDFYFYSKKESTVLIAAADCTGHGVPGALMSMIGSEKMISGVIESTNPAVILNSLNKGIKSSLRQSDHEESTKDGMDIALVSLNLKTLEANYAGANRPIWIIRKDSREVEEIKATKKAIGGYTPDDQQYELHNIKFNKGDSFYLFTDGFADQFGTNGKKLMTKKFREILLDIQHLSMNEQEQHLHDFIEQWKGDVEQVDDVLVIGVRV